MKRPKTSTVLICGGLFLFFLVLRFPYRNLRGFIFGKIYTSTKIRVESEDLYPTFLGWPGLRLRNASVSIPLQRRDTLDIASDRLTVRGSLFRLLPPMPGVSLYLQNLQQGGDLYVGGGRGGTRIIAELESRKLNLEQFSVPGMREPLAGNLTADGNFSLEQSDFTKSTGQLRLEMDRLRIPGQNLQGIILPVFEMQDLHARVGVKSGVMEINEFRFGKDGSDVKGSLAGEVRLARTANEFFINLVLRIQLSDKYRADPASATLVSFLNSYKTGTPGDYAMKWSAKVRDMQSNFMMALPQPL